MFENGNYRRRKRRPKQVISNIPKSSSTSSSIPLDDSSLSSSESNHNSFNISSHHDEDDQYSYLKIEPSDNPTKKRRRSSSPEVNNINTKKIKTVSAFSSIDTLIAPKKESKAFDSFLSPCRYNPQPAYLSSIPSQYLSLLTNNFALNPTYNRAYPSNK